MEADVVRALLLCLALWGHGSVWAGPVNINTASAPELERELKGVGPALAARIIRYRQQHGPFRRAEDLQKVPYVGIKTFRKNQADIQVQLP